MSNLTIEIKGLNLAYYLIKRFNYSIDKAVKEIIKLNQIKEADKKVFKTELKELLKI